MKALVAWMGLVLGAGPALAHGALPGAGGFYAGAAHPFVAIEHLLVLLAVGLMLGRDGGRAVLLVLAAGLTGGLWYGVSGTGTGTGTQVLLLAATLAIGGVLALQIRLPVWGCGVVFGAVGLGIGMETDLPAGDTGVAALGVAAGVILIVLNAMALGSVLVGPRGALVLRVAGAWMFAVALMVLALHLRGLT